MINVQSEEKVFVTHTGGIVKISGEVIDSLYVESTLEFDPMEYLRDFDYGTTTSLPDGTTLREYTIIADSTEASKKYLMYSMKIPRYFLH